MGNHPARLRRLLCLAVLVLAVQAVEPAPSRDLTFFLVSDVHVGMAYKDCAPPVAVEDYNRHVEETLDAIAAIPGHPWPTGGAFAGLPPSPVAKPQGLIVAGDLTQSGTVAQWKDFERIFPLLGKDPSRFPVFASAGNHDGGSAANRIRDGLRTRNHALAAAHPDMVLSEDGLHSAWVWQGVHFINVNLYPGDEVKADSQPGAMWDPEHSLAFLKARIAALPAPATPLVVIMHFGLKTNSWWDQDRRKAFYQAIRGSNVVAILHGHTHAITHLPFPDDADRAAFAGDGPRFDCFSAGAFKVEGGAQGAPFPGWRNPCECYVFRITSDRFIAAHYTGRGDGWNAGKDAARLVVVKPLGKAIPAP